MEMKRNPSKEFVASLKPQSIITNCHQNKRLLISKKNSHQFLMNKNSNLSKINSLSNMDTKSKSFKFM